MEHVSRLLDAVEEETADLDLVSARIVSDKLAIDPASPSREAQERRIVEVEQLVSEQRQFLQTEVAKALDPLGVEELEWVIRDAQTVVELLVRQQTEGWAEPPWVPPDEATDATWVTPTPQRTPRRSAAASRSTRDAPVETQRPHCQQSRVLRWTAKDARKLLDPFGRRLA